MSDLANEPENRLTLRQAAAAYYGYSREQYPEAVLLAQ